MEAKGPDRGRTRATHPDRGARGAPPEEAGPTTEGSASSGHGQALQGSRVVGEQTAFGRLPYGERPGECGFASGRRAAAQEAQGAVIGREQVGHKHPLHFDPFRLGGRRVTPGQSLLSGDGLGTGSRAEQEGGPIAQERRIGFVTPGLFGAAGLFHGRQTGQALEPGFCAGLIGGCASGRGRKGRQHRRTAGGQQTTQQGERKNQRADGAGRTE